jgi:hypothetical protein
MKPSQHDSLKRAVSEAGVCRDTALIEAVGILVTVSSDVDDDLRSGHLETTQQVTARRLRALLDSLGIPTQLVVRSGGGMRAYTVYGLHFSPGGGSPRGDAQAQLRHCVSAPNLRARCGNVAQARALWRGVLLASQPQRRRMPGFAIAVRDADLARLLVDIAKTQLGIDSAHRAAAPPGTRVVIDDVADAERLIRCVLIDDSVLVS